jgi:hypothetical protein
MYLTKPAVRYLSYDLPADQSAAPLYMIIKNKNGLTIRDVVRCLVRLTRFGSEFRGSMAHWISRFTMGKFSDARMFLGLNGELIPAYREADIDKTLLKTMKVCKSKIREFAVQQMPKLSAPG